MKIGKRYLQNHIAHYLYAAIACYALYRIGIIEQMRLFVYFILFPDQLF